MNQMRSTSGHPIFIVWKGYQRRAEVLAPLLNTTLHYLPHHFRGKALRPLDYVTKFSRMLVALYRTRPAYAIVQAPPPFAALPALLTRTPYVLDAHNTVIRSGWTKLPLSKRLIRNARGIIAHNEEILAMMREDFPDATYYHIPDPVTPIPCHSTERDPKQIAFICSFDADEPVESIIRAIERLPDYTFVITADPKRLPRRQRRRLKQCSNLRLPGFLSTDAYHELLCSSSAVITLTTRDATQQSGACEALASNTPLITSRTTLSEKLFGAWAILVENTPESIVDGVRSVSSAPLNLSAHREHWNTTVHQGIDQLKRSMHPAQHSPNVLA